MKNKIASTLAEVRRDIAPAERKQGESLCDDGRCVILSYSRLMADFIVLDPDDG
jgi:hypothetical protein